MSRILSLNIFIVLSLASGRVSAQAIDAPTKQNQLSTSSLKLPDKSTSRNTLIKSRIEFEQEQSEYTSFGLPEFRDGAAKQNSSLILRLDEQLDKGAFTAKLKAKDQWSATENWNYGDVHEFYAGFHGEAGQISLGRKLETWSAWDQEWQQGIFQPRYMENRMRPEAAGLAGVFGNIHSEHLSATGAFLPFFIPDFGPHFYVKDDHFASKNPWFHPPTDSFVLRGGKGDIHYRLDHPETEQVIKHAGAAAKLEFKNQGYLARVSGAYKPMPQFILGFPSEHQFSTGQSEDHMNITVTPRVAYDRVVNLDNQYTSGAWSLSGSFAYSNPEDPGTPTDWTSQQIRPATIWSGAVTRRLDDSGLQASTVRLGFLKVHGGDADDSGTLSGKETLFERRFQFYEAYLLGLHKDFHSFLRSPLETEVRIIYDRMQGGGMMSFNTGTSLGGGLHAEAQADFIGLLTSTANITDGFLSEYRANNRLSLGLSYVF